MYGTEILEIIVIIFIPTVISSKNVCSRIILDSNLFLKMISNKQE